MRSILKDLHFFEWTEKGNSRCLNSPKVFRGKTEPNHLLAQWSDSKNRDNQAVETELRFTNDVLLQDEMPPFRPLHGVDWAWAPGGRRALTRPGFSWAAACRLPGRCQVVSSSRPRPGPVLPAVLQESAVPQCPGGHGRRHSALNAEGTPAEGTGWTLPSQCAAPAPWAVVEAPWNPETGWSLTGGQDSEIGAPEA